MVKHTSVHESYCATIHYVDGADHSAELSKGSFSPNATQDATFNIHMGEYRLQHIVSKAHPCSRHKPCSSQPGSSAHISTEQLLVPLFGGDFCSETGTELRTEAVYPQGQVVSVWHPVGGPFPLRKQALQGRPRNGSSRGSYPHR